MKLGVVGSRGFDNWSVIRATLDRIRESKKITSIISGGARGPDKLGARYAKEHGIPLTEHLPDWEKHGRSAGYIRNVDIVNDSDIILAFYDGRSSGTKHTMTTAHEQGKKVYVVDPDGNMSRWEP